jgi:starvation-inducible DNA-binding protein
MSKNGRTKNPAAIESPRERITGPDSARPSVVGLSEATRSKVVVVLQARLADAIDLGLQAKQAHWNVKGPNFFSLHQLFDAISADAREYADLVAERAVQLGAVAVGTLSEVARETTLEAYPPSETDGRAHVDLIARALATFGESIRTAIDQAADAGDATTADVFTEISRGVDKWTWMVDAHRN